MLRATITDIVSAMNNDSEPALKGSAHLQTYMYLGNVTTDAGDEGDNAALLPIEFVVVLVLAAACVIAGVVYAYVHISRAARSRVDKHKRRPSSFAGSHHHHHAMSVDEGSRKTHLMFFRRTTSVAWDVFLSRCSNWRQFVVSTSSVCKSTCIWGRGIPRNMLICWP